jgi:RimJ/RimL family protein N-acetyltransferase
MSDQEYFEENGLPQAKPYFQFRNLSPSKHLTYHLLSWSNYLDIYQMFKDDSSEFVDERFKDCEKLHSYMEYQMNFAWTSSRRGGCDWLLRKGEQTVGILHLYDLTCEVAQDRHRACTIGFAIAEPFRRQGLLREAVQHLLTLLFTEFSIQKVLSFTRKENIATIRFLTNMEFTPCDEEYWDERFRYFRIKKEKFLAE